MKLHLTETAEQVLIKLRDWVWWCLITGYYSSITSLKLTRLFSMFF